MNQEQNMLRLRVKQSINQIYESTGAAVKTVDGRRYGFIDNWSDVLAVVHLDYVGMGGKNHGKYVEYGNRVVSPALDDRLGLYVILDLLPQHGVVPDVLLTEDEEVGRSTAGLFKTDKRYNWIFSFDRRGTDVVMYDYENDESAALLRSAGFKLGMGSFSDICYLEDLEVIGFNFGVGYHGEHTPACYANYKDVASQVAKFVMFYHEHAGTYMEWDGMGYWQRFARQESAYKYPRYSTIGGAIEEVETRFVCNTCHHEYSRALENSFSAPDEVCCYCEEAVYRWSWQDKTPKLAAPADESPEFPDDLDDFLEDDIAPLWVDRPGYPDTFGDPEFQAWLLKVNHQLSLLFAGTLADHDCDWLGLFCSDVDASKLAVELMLEMTPDEEAPELTPAEKKLAGVDDEEIIESVLTTEVSKNGNGTDKDRVDGGTTDVSGAGLSARLFESGRQFISRLVQ